MWAVVPRRAPPCRSRARAGPCLLALVAAVATLLVAGCGGGGGGGRAAEPSPPARSGAPATTAALPAEGGPPALAVGLTEPNPLFVWNPADRPLSGPFARWNRAVGAIRPAYFRLVLDWATLQPAADRPADLALPNPGCMRTILPCGGYEGVREQLQALASRQRQGGWDAVVVITGAPAWAVGSPAGCERKGTQPRSRTPRADALPAYERLVRDVLAEAKAAGARLRWWSAWNEPNRYLTLSPQRAVCSAAADSIGAARYVPLVRTLRAALQAAPGDQRYILGDLAGVLDPDPGSTTVSEFIRALPTDLACGTPVFALHAYVSRVDPAPAAIGALARHHCRHRHAIWITQTGALAPRADAPPASPERLRACRALHESLLRWYRNPSVTAAFQYTVREDDTFPMGLVDPTLTRAEPTLRLWRVWGGGLRPDAADPPPAGACGSPAR
jgi:hypothetical protein